MAMSDILFPRGLGSFCLLATLLVIANPPKPGAQPVATAQGQTAASVKAGSQARPLSAQLFENTSFWSQKGQPEIALHELERILELSPRDPDALALVARQGFQAGQYDAGDRYRRRLREIAPNDARLAFLDLERPMTEAEKQTLAEARQSAGRGDKDAAVAAYRKLFQGKVPDSLAAEYYMVLGTVSPPGFSEASDQLRKAVDRWPGDASFPLAYAELQTYQEKTRTAGIDQLRGLTRIATVGEAARIAWRNALLWQGADVQARDQLLVYLGDYPGDPAIQAKLKEMQQELPDEGVLLRMRAYQAGKAGKKDEAENGFQAAIKLDPDDAEAIIMLSIIRRNQGRGFDADILAARALALAPDRYDEFAKDMGPQALQMDNAMLAATGFLIASAKYVDAEALLTHIDNSGNNASNLMLLAVVQLRQGHLDDAEQHYRKARLMEPRSGHAICGIADVSWRRGRYDESSSLYDEAATLFSRAKDHVGLLRVGLGRAAVVRARTAGLDDVAAMSIYQQSVQADPANMRIRSDLASRLLQGPNPARAWEVIDKGIELNHGDPDSLRVALEFTNRAGDSQRAAELMRRLGLSDTHMAKPVTDQQRIDLEIERAKRDAIKRTLYTREAEAQGGKEPLKYVSK